MPSDELKSCCKECGNLLLRDEKGICKNCQLEDYIQNCMKS